MPSQKPQILVRTTEEIKEKLRKIAEKDKRSLSVMAEIIIEQYINNYEENNGTINISFNDNATNNGDINIGK